MGASLSQDDRDWVKLIARDIAFQAIKETLAEHVKACPHGQRLGRSLAWIAGLVIGLALASGGLGYAIAKMPWLP